MLASKTVPKMFLRRFELIETQNIPVTYTRKYWNFARPCSFPRRIFFLGRLFCIQSGHLEYIKSSLFSYLAKKANFLGPFEEFL